MKFWKLWFPQGRNYQPAERIGFKYGLSSDVVGGGGGQLFRKQKHVY